MAGDKFDETLQEALFHTIPKSKYPFYVVQLSAEKERPLNGVLVSDALAWLLSHDNYTHVLLQTHGWNTPPTEAIKVPFSQFIAGMQDDPTMPSDASFKPLFIAFTWDTLPLKFLLEPDALTRMELLCPALRECESADRTLTAAADAVADAARGGAVDAVREPLRELRDAGRLGIDEREMGDADTDALVDRAVAMSAASAHRADRASAEREPSRSGFVSKLLDALQRLLFGRLIERGVRTGEVLHGVIAKLMRAGRAKYCLMAHSLGAHVVAGALLRRGELPFRLHTVFIVQGACNREWFGPDGRYRGIVEQVAGPVVCTLSEKDVLLMCVFKPFHGDAVGCLGFVDGVKMDMRGKEEGVLRPYEWRCGGWNSVDGTRFIDEDNPLIGGHCDYKGDETTMTYWSAINVELDGDKYGFPVGVVEGKIQGFIEKILQATPLRKLLG